MVEEILVESKFDDSVKLIQTLDAEKLNPTKAMWHFYGDAGEWRLILAGPEFDKWLPKEEALAYQKLAEAINKAQLSSMSIGEIKLVKTNYEIFKLTSMLVQTGPNVIGRAYFENMHLNGMFFRYLLIMRSA